MKLIQYKIKVFCTIISTKNLNIFIVLSFYQNMKV